MSYRAALGSRLHHQLQAVAGKRFAQPSWNTGTGGHTYTHTDIPSCPWGLHNRAVSHPYIYPHIIHTAIHSYIHTSIHPYIYTSIWPYPKHIHSYPYNHAPTCIGVYVYGCMAVQMYGCVR